MIEIMDSGIGKVIQTLKDKRNVWTYPVSVYERQRLYQWRGFIKQLMADLSNTLSQLANNGYSKEEPVPLSIPQTEEAKPDRKGSICREPRSYRLIFFPPAWILLPHITPTRFYNQKWNWPEPVSCRLYGKQKYSRAIFSLNIRPHAPSCLTVCKTSTCQRQTALGIDSPYHRSFWDTKIFPEQFLKPQKEWKQMGHDGQSNNTFILLNTVQRMKMNFNYYQSLYPDKNPPKLKVSIKILFKFSFIIPFSIQNNKKLWFSNENLNRTQQIPPRYLLKFPYSPNLSKKKNQLRRID